MPEHSGDGRQTTDVEVALDDAARVLARIEADEAAAEEMRSLIERDGLPRLIADDEIGRHLEDGERILAIRPGTRLARAEGSPDNGSVIGRLYLTDRRLLLDGREVTAIPLVGIEELSIVGERLLVALHDGRALSFELAGPRQLRVIVAAAVADARR